MFWNFDWLHQNKNQFFKITHIDKKNKIEKKFHIIWIHLITTITWVDEK